jgi:hypothetical protein
MKKIENILFAHGADIATKVITALIAVWVIVIIAKIII